LSTITVVVNMECHTSMEFAFLDVDMV